MTEDRKVEFFDHVWDHTGDPFLRSRLFTALTPF